MQYQTQSPHDNGAVRAKSISNLEDIVREQQGVIALLAAQVKDLRAQLQRCQPSKAVTPLPSIGEALLLDWAKDWVGDPIEGDRTRPDSQISLRAEDVEYVLRWLWARECIKPWTIEDKFRQQWDEDFHGVEAEAAA